MYNDHMSSLQILVVVLAVAGGLIGAIGDGFFEQWAKKGQFSFLLGGYIFWGIMATIFAFMLRKNLMGVGQAAVLFLLVNIVAALLIGRHYFAEKVSTADWVGISIALVAFLIVGLNR